MAGAKRQTLARAHKRNDEGTFPAPTRERIRQAGQAPIAVPVLVSDGPSPYSVPDGRYTAKPKQSRLQQIRAHRFEWPVDRLRHVLTDEQYDAAERLLKAHLGRGGHARVCDYGNGVGGSDPSSRLPLTKQQEEAGKAWAFLWRHDALSAQVREVLTNFVLEEPVLGAKRPLTEEEYGRLKRGTSCQWRAKGYSEGALQLALDVLAGVVREFEIGQREMRERAKAQQRALLNYENPVNGHKKPTGSLWDKSWDQ